MRWSKWKIQDGRLVAVTRYLPIDHAFGNMIVTVEALADDEAPPVQRAAGKVDFYTSVWLEGAHVTLGEQGWWPNGDAAVKEAINEAANRAAQIAAALKQLQPPTTEEFAKLRRLELRREHERLKFDETKHRTKLDKKRSRRRPKR